MLKMAAEELKFGYTTDCETSWQAIYGDVKGFYMYKSNSSTTAYFYRFGLRIEEFKCKPNLATPLANMDTGTTATRVMYLQNTLSTYLTTDCPSNLMTFSSLAAAGATDSNYSLTLSAGVVTGVKTFNVIYTNKLGVVTTVPISYTVIWRPVNGANYYPSNASSLYIENVDTSAVTCILNKITACRDGSNYLRVVKFDFTGCAQISWLYNNVDTTCNTLAYKTEEIITGASTHFKGCKRSSSNSYIGGFMLKNAGRELKFGYTDYCETNWKAI
jgi:hypothetical protein